MKLRLRFSKLGKVRFTSHRDVARIWERALRRAELPLAYTEGFSPRPKLHFGLALPTGAESEAEYLDVDLRHDVELDDLPGRATAALPVGFTCTAAAALEGRHESLQQAVTSCTWRIEVTGGRSGPLSEAVAALLATPELVVTRERKGKPVTDDLRPAVLHLEVAPTPAAHPVLVAELATQPRGLRPSELLALLDPPVGAARLRRTHQWMIVDGARREPLPAAPPSPHAELRAS